MAFCKDFAWGAATASYQIEGAWNEDGKGLNIWDIYSHNPENIADNSTGDMCCDHYHRFREDVLLMKEIGLRAYRFSISWARILPSGTGEVNEKGIQFYSDLIDCLLENGIEPYITLYHWDLPYELHKKGAWLNEQIIDGLRITQRSLPSGSLTVLHTSLHLMNLKFLLDTVICPV